MHGEDESSSQSSQPAANPPTGQPSARSSNIAIALIAILVVGATAIRAARRSITHDEAHTYFTFVLGGLDAFFFHYIPNNHPINTLLVRIATAFFGPSDLAVRLGALIAGAAAVGVLATMIMRSRPRVLVAVASAGSLFLLPTFFDFASLARGYVIGAFFLIAAAQRILAMTDPAKEKRASDPLLIAILHALAVLSVPTFLAGAVAQTLACFLYRLKFDPRPAREVRSDFVRAMGITVFLPATVLFLPLLNLEAPTDSIAGKATFAEFMDACAAHLGSSSATSSHDGGMLLSWRRSLSPQVFFGFVAAAAALSVVGFMASKKTATRSYAERWAIIGGVTTILTAGLHVAAVKLLGFHWPAPRVLIDLFVVGWSTVVAVAIAADRFLLIGRIVSRGLFGAMALASAIFLSNINFDATLDWSGDASAREIHREIADMFRDRRDKPAEVWSEPLIERSIEFYRVAEKTDWIAPIETSWGEQPKKPYDAYILHDGFLAVPEVVQYLRIVKRFDPGGRFIAVVK